MLPLHIAALIASSVVVTNAADLTKALPMTCAWECKLNWSPPYHFEPHLSNLHKMARYASYGSYWWAANMPECGDDRARRPLLRLCHHTGIAVKVTYTNRRRPERMWEQFLGCFRDYKVAFQRLPDGPVVNSAYIHGRLEKFVQRISRCSLIPMLIFFFTGGKAAGLQLTILFSLRIFVDPPMGHVLHGFLFLP